MRKVSILIILLAAYLFIACKNNKVSDVEDLSRQLKQDSVLWYFYAYTFKSKVGFSEANGQKILLPAVQCDVSIDSIREDSGFSEYLISYKKEGYQFYHIYDGLMIYGFKEKDGIFYPITGMIRLDSFDNSSYAQKDNKSVDSIFTEYLKVLPNDSLSTWLKKEVAKRDIK
jgi:hypothetical protein